MAKGKGKGRPDATAPNGDKFWLPAELVEGLAELNRRSPLAVAALASVACDDEAQPGGWAGSNRDDEPLPTDPTEG